MVAISRATFFIAAAATFSLKDVSAVTLPQPCTPEKALRCQDVVPCTSQLITGFTKLPQIKLPKDFKLSEREKSAITCARK